MWCFYVSTSDKHKSSKTFSNFRPELINVLFHRSVHDQFQRGEKNKYKRKEKTGKKCFHANIVENFSYFLNTIFCFLDFAWRFLMINVQDDPKNKSIESGLKESLRSNN